MKRKRNWNLIIFCMIFALIWTFGMNGSEVEAADSDITIDEEHFPDEIFRKYVSDEFDQDKDGLLSLEECENVTNIKIVDSSVKNIKGIEYFSNLETLYAPLDSFVDTDISKIENVSATFPILLEDNLRDAQYYINDFPDYSKIIDHKIKYYYDDYYNKKEVILDGNSFDLIKYSSALYDNLYDGFNCAYQFSENKTITIYFEVKTLEEDDDITETQQIVEIDETHFPDDLFRKAVKNYDEDGDGFLS